MIDFDRDDPPYCRTCRRVLMLVNNHWEHTPDPRDRLWDDHPIDFVARRSELANPIIKCDFCCAADARWQYTFPDARTDTKYLVEATVVDAGDYRDQGRAARVRRIERGGRETHNWGDVWTACEPCAEAIEANDLMGLVSHVAELLPAKLRRANRIASSRAEILRTYEPMLAAERTRQPLDA